MWLIRPSYRCVLLAAIGVSVMAGGGEAKAQGKVESSFVATLAGIPIGKGRWMIDIGDDKYSAIGNGTTAGLLRIFASGDGNSSVRGTLINGAPMSTNFAATINFTKWTENYRMVLENGTVKEASIDPTPQPNSERVPLTNAHRQGVADPVTASLMRVPGRASLTSPEVCQRTLNVFDGRMRYDLQLSYKRMDQVSTDRGYVSSAVVCAVRYVPIAGHNPYRTAIKYLIDTRDMEMSLVPIAGTRVVVPFRVFIPTPIGPGIVQAVEFNTVALPRAASKMQ